MFTCAAAGAGSIYYFSSSLASRQLQLQAQLTSRRDDLLAHLEQAQQDLDLYTRYGKAFHRNQADGVYAGGQRLGWIELLGRVGEELHLPTLHYQIPARKPYYSEVVPDSGALGVYTTDIKLSGNLFHEGDLLLLQEKFTQARLGLFRLSACDIRRRQNLSEAASTSNEALLKIDCTVEWASFVFDDQHKDEPDPADDEGMI